MATSRPSTGSPNWTQDEDAKLLDLPLGLALVERTPHAPVPLQRPEPQLVVCDAEAPAHALPKQHAIPAGLGYGWGRNAPPHGCVAAATGGEG